MADIQRILGTQFRPGIPAPFDPTVDTDPNMGSIPINDGPMGAFYGQPNPRGPEAPPAPAVPFDPSSSGSARSLADVRAGVQRALQFLSAMGDRFSQGQNKNFSLYQGQNARYQQALDAVRMGQPIPSQAANEPDAPAAAPGQGAPAGGPPPAPGYGPTYGGIGVGGPAPTRSIPRNGRRAPVTINGQASSSSDDGMGAFLAAAGDGTSSAPAQPQQQGNAFDVGADEPVVDLSAMYRDRTNRIGKPTDDLTGEQKNKTALDFFLGMLANSSQPGATALGAAGTAGQNASAEVDRYKERNYARSAAQIGQQREDAYREVGLADKTEDNRSKLKQLGITAQHYNDMGAHMKALEKLEGQKLDITKQYNDGRLQAREYEVQLKEIQANAALVRASMEKLDPLERTIQTMKRYLPDVSNEQLVRMALSKGAREGDSDDRLIDDTWKQATARAASSGMPAPSRDQIVAARKYGGQISRSHPDYQATLKDPSIGGDKKKLDALLQTRGLRVVD